MTCNFTLHYLFESEEFLINSLNNISSRLKPNGYFIGTTIDGDKLNLLNKPYFEKGNNFDNDEVFGKSYTFNLMDNKNSGNYFDKHINNDIEYKVSIKEFIKYANNAGLKMITYKPFNEIKYDRSRFSPIEELVSSLYSSFVFIKKN